MTDRKNYSKTELQQKLGSHSKDWGVYFLRTREKTYSQLSSWDLKVSIVVLNHIPYVNIHFFSVCFVNIRSNTYSFTTPFLKLLPVVTQKYTQETFYIT